MANSLSVTGLDAGYGAVRVLEDVSLSVAPGETVVLLGTNGNGKSTLMKCVMGIVRRRPLAASSPTSTASVTISSAASTEEIVDLGISLVPEGRRLFPKLTVEENLLLGAFRPSARGEIGRNLDIVLRDLPGAARAAAPVGRQPQRRRAADAGAWRAR